MTITFPFWLLWTVGGIAGAVVLGALLFFAWMGWAFYRMFSKGEGQPFMRW